MAAPDFRTLYDFPGQLNAVWKTALEAALTAASLTAEVEITREDDKKPTPRIELSAAIGPAGSQRTAIGQASPKQVAVAFSFSMSCAVWSSRKATTGNADIHGALVGLVLYAFSAGAKAIPPSS